MSTPSAAPPVWMAAFLSMARELWVLKDRQRVLEALLASHDIVPPDAVSNFQPDASLQAQLDSECRACPTLEATRE